MTTKKKSKKSVNAYKAFDSDFKCLKFQYEVGKVYNHEGPVTVCQAGFHACENPLDVLNYYPLINGDGKLNRFGKVTQSGDIDRESNKTCSARIKIECELTFSAFVTESINYIIDLTKKSKKKAASGNYSKLAASGNYSKLAASGNYSKLAASGNYSKLAASGDDSKLAASGDDSKLAASGNYSNLAASGNYSNLAASGDDSKLAASGYNSKLAASGKRGVLVSAEKNCYVKGSVGTLICLCFYSDEGHPVKLVTGKIGDNNLQPDTWYGLNNKADFVVVVP